MLEFTYCLHFPRYSHYIVTGRDWSNHFNAALHFDTTANFKRLRLFWTAFTAMFCYEVIPSYIFPLLNGVNVFCLASQKASPNVQNVFTNVFGGSDSNEGLGLFGFGFDWQFITSSYVLLRCLAGCTTINFNQVYESTDNPARFVLDDMCRLATQSNSS